MGFSKFLTSLTKNREEVNNRSQPINAELQQGTYYLDRRRQMSMKLKPNLKLIEAFTSEPPTTGSDGGGLPPTMPGSDGGGLPPTMPGSDGGGLPPPTLGGGGAGRPPTMPGSGGGGIYPTGGRSSKKPAVVISADDDDDKDDSAELSALEDKFNGLLSQYGTSYKNYMESVNRFMGKQKSEWQGKNIATTEAGQDKIWYVNKYGVARQYPSMKAYNNRPPSCAGTFIRVSFTSNDFSDQGLELGPEMHDGEPCGLEGQNVKLAQLSGADAGSPCGSGGDCVSGICSPGGCSTGGGTFVIKPPSNIHGVPTPNGGGGGGGNNNNGWRPGPHHAGPGTPSYPPDGYNGGGGGGGGTGGCGGTEFGCCPDGQTSKSSASDSCTGGGGGGGGGGGKNIPGVPTPGPNNGGGGGGGGGGSDNGNPSANCCAFSPGGAAPPVQYCGKFIKTLKCNWDGDIDWDYMDKQQSSADHDCGMMVDTNMSGYCECADGTIKARVNCGHPKFTCEEACAPGGEHSGPGGGPVWQPYQRCESYEGGAEPMETPLLCLRPSDGSCWKPTFGPVIGGRQRAGLAECNQHDDVPGEYSGYGAYLIKNDSFPHTLAGSCGGQGSNCDIPGEVCPWGVTGASETSFGDGPDFARNYKCCDIRGKGGWMWQKIGKPTDDCPGYADTVETCGCQWTMDAGDSRPKTALERFDTPFGEGWGSDGVQLGSWGSPYKWCSGAVDQKACEIGIGGSNCRFNEKKHCVSTITAPGKQAPQDCKSRSYKLVRTGVKGNYGRTDVGECVNDGDVLAVRKGTLGELTAYCDNWPGCQYVDFSYTTGAGGPFGRLFPKCTVGTGNATRQVYDGQSPAPPCYPNILPGGQVNDQPAAGVPFTPTSAPYPKPAQSGSGKCHKGTSCPHMYGHDSKATQQAKCAAACCTFTDHWYGNVCE